MKTSLVQPALFRRAVLATSLLLNAALAQPARAQHQPAGVQRLNDFTYRVWASNPAVQPGRVQLVDLSSGRVLYEERSSAVSFGQKFNVSQLPDGRYAFVVNVGPQKFSYALHLRTAATRTAELHADTVRARVALSARF
jgi:hypothetical protein